MSKTGHIFQVSSSAGGVPKLAQAQAEVTALGLASDQQRNTKVHGGPDRALCLYSLECILALQREGHPIFPGAAGENITIADLDWSLVQPGIRLKLGAGVRVEITGFASPCRNIAPAFAAGHIELLSEKAHPGWARAYARVLQTGTVRPGDPVALLD